MERKAQAATEFLMTYGWAILAAVIVIGALAAFGVFSPSQYIPNKCIVSSPWGCNAGTASTEAVQLELRNGGGESLTLTSVVVADCGTNATSMTVLDGDLQMVNVVCSPASLTAGEKFQGEITLSYTKSGSSLTLSSTGDITDEV